LKRKEASAHLSDDNFSGKMSGNDSPRRCLGGEFCIIEGHDGSKTDAWSCKDCIEKRIPAGDTSILGSANQPTCRRDAW